ncbi:hypothetical protein LUZ60_008731 [Juncus effusus]|nr:hypothetical protein LUZ60_008731 [Juncus effusus]
MASQDSEDGSNGSKKRRPQFFRVLIPNPFAKLYMPKKFRKKYLDKNPQSKATLLSPQGKFWHMDFIQEGENLYLETGVWSDFAKSLDLKTGYFVIFRYEGNSVFTVKVFDDSCCLKEYDELDSETDSESENSDKECVTLSENENENSEDEVQDKSSPMATSNKRKFEDFTSTKRQKSIELSERTPKSILNSTRFPQFEKVIRPYSSKYMGLPIKFCNKHNLYSRESIFFKNQKGKKKYPVRLLFRDKEVHLGKGWRVFAEESKLKDGDLCVFELISKSTLLVQPKEKTGETQQTAKKRRSESSSLREDKVTPYPQFEKIIRNFNLTHGYLNIVKSFCVQNGLIAKRIITLKDSNGKSWPIRFYLKASHAKLQKGWRKFSKAYDLKEGDKCVFKLVEENTFLVNVEKKQTENVVTENVE